MRNCPACKYSDDPHFRPRHFDTMIDIIPIDDLEKIAPLFSRRLRRIQDKRFPRITLHVTSLEKQNAITIGNNSSVAQFLDHYVYRITKKGMVWRKEEKLFNDEGWSVPSDGSGSPKSAKFKKAISGRTPKSYIQSPEKLDQGKHGDREERSTIA